MESYAGPGPSASTDGLSAHLLCPDCRHRIGADLVCTACTRKFSRQGSTIVLLPSRLDASKTHEEETWRVLPHEGENQPAWKAFLHKHNEVFYFTETILPHLDLKGNVLEIASGSCWASALLKQRFPVVQMVASDVSPTALKKGESLVQLLGSSVDAYVACDLENLPFEDEYFDFVFGSAALHHLGALDRGVSEVSRVLKRGGRFLGILEPASGPFFGSIWESKVGLAGQRAHEHGIHEAMYTANQWRDAFERSGFSAVEVVREWDWRYKLTHWLPPMYFRALEFVPKRWIGNVLPCSVNIRATK
ncbi:MAG: methyltransferase domain-containing protein [Thermoplasmata archaeon]|nr:methyltransferase domain-containing protein [Thermoplasmata archaeon]